MAALCHPQARPPGAVHIKLAQTHTHTRASHTQPQLHNLIGVAHNTALRQQIYMCAYMLPQQADL